MALIPSPIGCLQSSIIWLSVFSDSLGYDFLSRQQSSLPHTKQVIASGPGGSSVALYERMNPIESPQRICRSVVGSSIIAQFSWTTEKNRSIWLGTSLKWG